MSQVFDVIVEKGTVVDGTGRPAFEADVGIVADRILAIGDLRDAQSVERIGAVDHCVAPGFIDVHTHSDLAAFLPREHRELRLASLRQGVTTEICGNCGFSVFPTTTAHADDVDRYLQVVLGSNARGFQTLAEYRAAVNEHAPATNVGTLVGHGTLRAAVLGLERRPPTPEESRQLENALDEACDEGAVGLSSGLIYAPGVYAQTGELTALARVAAKYGRPYVTHLRDEADHVGDALEEALRIGVDSGAAVQISHHKTSGRKNFGRTRDTIPLLERARESGLDVMIDVYPYTAGSTTLTAVLPPWVSEGGIDQLLKRLKDPLSRARLRRDLARGLPGWQQLVGPGGWGDIVVATAPANPHYEGRAIDLLAGQRRCDELDFVCDLLLAEQGQVTIILHLMAEEDVERVIASPLSIIGSDGIPLPGEPHPRWAGTFVRVLGEYVRKRSLLTLEEAVRKMTHAAAERFGLTGRGVLTEGAFADVVVFDPETVADGATYEQPLTHPVGVSHVIVNGAISLRAGSPTDAHAGRFIRP
jgi:N-acyl-D-aspartate/D-glutamate deacylase